MDKLKELRDRYRQEDVEAVLDRMNPEVKKKYAHLDLPKLIEGNFRYVSEHGLGERELTRWVEVLDAWKAYTEVRPKRPMPGDRVVLTATGSICGNVRTYRNALIDSQKWGNKPGKVYICTEPYVPSLSFDPTGRPSLSTSGGYFGYALEGELTFVEEKPGEFKFFPCGCRANGALYLQLPVRWWSFTSELFY